MSGATIITQALYYSMTDLLFLQIINIAYIKMLTKNKFVEEKLKDLITSKENEETTYDWIKDFNSINFWDFLSVNFLDVDRFFTMLDIENGPHSGWEKFAEVLGLTLWEDLCYQYHNGAGPTKAVLSKLLSKDDYDRNLSLGSVLEILKEMDRFDILLQIDWKCLAEKCISSAPSEKVKIENDEPKTLVFQLNRSMECDQLIKSAPVTDPDNEISSLELLNRYNSLKKKKSKKRENKSNTFCILMSYAPDAESWAEKVSKELKGHITNGQEMKVLMIGNPQLKRALAMDPSNTLHKWFNQVRYVVPVLSPQYLKQIQNLDTAENCREIGLYNRLIYRFTLDQFVKFGSRNLRCRPICPDSYFPEVQNSSVV
ncbi:hypothetical protein Avbf_02946 [Armadillidium vulgare]|nr:hypothetical protein Avbf_02946 [Armadillidium vulgare]